MHKRLLSISFYYIKRELKFQFADKAARNALVPVIMSIMIVASIVDTSVVKLSVFTGGLTTTWNIIAFSVLVIIYSIGQYIILHFIRRKIEISGISPINTIHRIVSVSQYFMISLLVIIILQIILTSSYSLFLLKLVVLTSCGLSVALLGFLAKKFFMWSRSNRDIIVITYAIAMGILSVNIAFMMVSVTGALNSQEDEIRYIKAPVTTVTNLKSPFYSIYYVSSILSFVLVWVATVLLLRYYSKKIGTAKYWVIVSAPLFYFLTQFQAIFLNLFDSFRLSDPTLFGIVYTLIFTMSKPIGGILFGVAFWVVSRRVSKHAIRDYLIVSAYGLILLFTSNQATSLIFAPYPPFGLVTVSLLGLSSYMLLVGIYSSAMSISRDIELRKFIHTVAAKEIKFLDRIGSAQMEEELVTKVIPLVKRKAHIMEQETGIKTSLSDTDIIQYLDVVLVEVRNLKKG